MLLRRVSVTKLGFFLKLHPFHLLSPFCSWLLENVDSMSKMLDIYGVGLAIAVVAYASQSAQLTHRDSPLAVIFFAITSILLFTLPRIGGDSRIPHVVVLLFGFTTILGYLFGTSLSFYVKNRR